MKITEHGKYAKEYFQKHQKQRVWGWVASLEIDCWQAGRPLVDRSLWSPWPQCSFLTHLIVRRWQVIGLTSWQVTSWPLNLVATSNLYLSLPIYTCLYQSVPVWLYCCAFLLTANIRSAQTAQLSTTWAFFFQWILLSQGKIWLIVWVRWNFAISRLIRAVGCTYTLNTGGDTWGQTKWK